jgi:maltooligosyltrehalose synthase
MEKAKIRLSEGTWENIFDNQRYSGNSWAGADDLLKNFPVALLVKENRGKTP